MPCLPSATHNRRPMKLTPFVPSPITWAMMALLSSLAETWQSVQPLVSLDRTVWGTWVLKTCPE